MPCPTHTLFSIHKVTSKTPLYRFHHSLFSQFPTALAFSDYFFIQLSSLFNNPTETLPFASANFYLQKRFVAVFFPFAFQHLPGNVHKNENPQNSSHR